MTLVIGRENEDLFKGILKEVDFTCDSEVEILHTFNMYATVQFRINDEFDDCYYMGKLVRLFGYSFNESGCSLKKVWFDAGDESVLLKVYPEIFSECDRSIITYDWDEFSSFIDTFKADYDNALKKKMEEAGDDLPF